MVEDAHQAPGNRHSCVSRVDVSRRSSCCETEKISARLYVIFIKGLL